MGNIWERIKDHLKLEDERLQMQKEYYLANPGSGRDTLVTLSHGDLGCQRGEMLS